MWGITVFRLVIVLVASLITPTLWANIASTPAITEEEAELKTALEKIQKNIQSLEQNIHQTKTEESQQLAQLASLEKIMGEKEEAQRQLLNALKANKATIADLNKTYEKETALTQVEQQALSTLLRATYTGQRHEKLKLLLTPSETAPVARRNQYYQYFYTARAKQLQALQQKLEDIALIQTQLEAEQARTLALAKLLEEEKSTFQKTLSERKILLAEMNQRMQQDTASLVSLKAQAKQLDTLCQTLQKELQQAKVSLPASDLPIFSKMKRKLPLPLPHEAVTLLPKKKKGNTPQHIYLSASEGTPVSAIYPGKVVFSEWLRGIGLLLIIDHGQGYMSLYGNNQKLYKTIGDTVEQGEMIARVGQSGGHSEGGLYFEIRKDGLPLDPSLWFQSE